jgi:hypothetical protein
MAFNVQTAAELVVKTKITTPDGGNSGHIESVWPFVDAEAIKDIVPDDAEAIDIFKLRCISVKTALENQGEKMSPEQAKEYCGKHAWLGGQMAREWIAVLQRGGAKK